MSSLLTTIFPFLFFLIPIVLTATCPKCPSSGIWSEWTTNETCSTDCGACSNVNRTRVCLSEEIGCPCLGEKESTASCNTEACNFSRSYSNIRTCCTGTLEIYKNWYHCGPLPADYSLSCCPDEGYWSNWSKFEKIPNQIAWERTRKCLSINHNCPCTGNDYEIVHECPCEAPANIQDGDTTCNSVLGNNSNPGTAEMSRPQVRVRKTLCSGYSAVETSNISKRYVKNVNGSSLITLGMIKDDGSCFKVEKEIQLRNTNLLLRIDYSCNLDTLKYQYENNNILKVAQFYFT